MKISAVFSSLALLGSSLSFADGLPSPAADQPVQDLPGISARYLTDYAELVHGLSWAAHLDTELFSNLGGGIQRGSEQNTAAQLGLQWDSDKAGWWSGGQIAVSAFGIYSGAVQTAYSGDIQTASNIYAPSAIRLYEANYRQQWAPWLATRVGMTDFNLYFDVTSNALQLLNSSFGLTPTISVNVPSAPTYPYSGLGAIVAAHGTQWSSKAGIFQGDAAQPFMGTFSRGYLALWEGAWHWGHGADEDPDDDTDEYGQYVVKIGAWHFGLGKAQTPAQGPSTSGVYGVMEAHYTLPSGPQIGPFLQWGLATAPENAVPGYWGAGVRLSHIIPRRDADSLSLGMARAWLRPIPVAASLETEPSAISNAETSYELTYVAQLTDHLSLQPDLQYITHPSGYYPNATVGILRLHLEFF